MTLSVMLTIRRKSSTGGGSGTRMTMSRLMTAMGNSMPRFSWSFAKIGLTPIAVAMIPKGPHRGPICITVRSADLRCLSRPDLAGQFVDVGEDLRDGGVEFLG